MPLIIFISGIRKTVMASTLFKENILLSGSYNIIHFESIDSTNTYAVDNIRDIPHHSVIIADTQTSGRGRLKRSWISDSPDNIYASFVIKPEQSYKDLPIVNFTQLFSVVLAGVLVQYGIKPAIKWPNDVLIGGKKCAGILSEVSFNGDAFCGLVVGIGINIGDDPTERLEIKQPVTCIKNETCMEVRKEDFLARIMNEYAERYEDFCSGGFASIRKKYMEYFSGTGKEISMVNSNYNGSGRVLGISDSGDLILETESGEIKNIVMGDILWKTSSQA